MSTEQDRTIKRRDFLKISGGLAATSLFAGYPIKHFISKTDEPSSENVVTKYGFCRMCHRSYCPTVYDVQEGVVTGVQGDTRGSWSEGRLCVRGNSALMHLYNPYRVKTPLKRTNPEKGLDVDPGWVEITWDEAMKTVSTKLKEIRKDDPRKFIYFSGFGGDYTYVDKLFARSFGTPNSMSATGSMCSVHWASGLTHGTSTEQVDPGHCNYCIDIGNTMGPNIAAAEPATRDIVDAIQRGMHAVVVDPRCSDEASKGEWLPIRPGMELPFLLSMANVILHELNTFDTWFVKNRSTGPYLVGPDGYYFRDPETKKPLIFDPTSGTSKTFDDPSIEDYALEGTFTVSGVTMQPAFAILKEQVKDYTPEWAEPITTIPAGTIRRISREFVDAAQIGSTIDIDGFTFPFTPAAITIGRGLTGHYHGHLAYWMAMVINVLIGAMDVPGGDNGAEPTPVSLKPDEDGILTPLTRGTNSPNEFSFPPKRIDAAEYYYYGFSQGFRMVDGILDPGKYHINYKPEMMLTFGGNLFSKASVDYERISEAFRQIPFIASISYHLDEHSAFADIVLPECSTLERYLTMEITERKCWSLARTNFSGSIVHQPVVPPMYQSLQADEILIMIADQVGNLYGEKGLNALVNANLEDEYKLDLDKKYSIAEILDRDLKSTYGPDMGLEAFKAAGFTAKPKKPAQLFNYFYFPGNKTRHPIYNERLKRVGEQLLSNLKEAGISHPNWSEEKIKFYYQPVPTWEEPPSLKVPPEYEFFGVVWKTPAFMFDISNTNANPYLQEISMRDPYFGSVLINPATARSKGFQDGDMVWVESQFGGKIGPFPVKLTETVHPEVAGFASGLSRKVVGMNPIAANGIPYNRLLSTNEDNLDVITASIEISPRLKIYKA